MMHSGDRITLRRTVLTVAIMLAGSVWHIDAAAQSFTRITALTNPVVTDGTTISYTGCAWGDFDGDGLDDLIVVNQNGNFLYRNDGEGRSRD